MAKKQAKTNQRKGPVQQEPLTKAPTMLTELDDGLHLVKQDGVGRTYCGSRIWKWRYGTDWEVTCEECKRASN